MAWWYGVTPLAGDAGRNSGVRLSGVTGIFGIQPGSVSTVPAAGIAGTLTALAIGHIVVALPYVVRTVSVSLAAMDRRLEAVAMSLGAGRWYSFRRVTLPLIKPGMLAGAVFAAVTSFGEVSISLFLSAPDTISVPVRVFNYVDQTFDPTVNAISVIFIVIAVLILLVIEKTIGLVKIL
ncbi:ABC transporter permease [Pantoea sp. B65]|uniref:ABC transporter permease n=1 Tax=Pantoea sp. B65 TaxID=2813359 RepID=UPI0039B5B356